ncbi:flagellar biosynthetic protein FliO [Hoeflea sp. YIM 152468]|uniref:flagellar biosynthetic protein FliO n=1 Tax=Hoeflea sp. YIM 152468 TaxID=3031759 RepID=UPI0023DAF5C3|nr:flagellar biosynthetic protein FliO [Hoeflea sp. YIM 152468]MDF1607438.1 flagellar biosynthetic protein FliO [Hoeflea sp. YIM 152468]
MPDSIIGGQGATLLTAILIVAVALLALVGVFWLIRARASSTFIRGGKTRLPRLAVLDATAVDTRRRLVLIRRDDVEHLVMIGGPTDIVIESRISSQQTQSDGPQVQSQDQRPPQQAHSASVQPALPTAVTAAVASTAAKAAPAAKTESAPAAGSIRSEAADVLDSARTRVFEEPSFDESTFDDLTEVPPAQASHVPRPASSPRSMTPTPPTGSTATMPPRVAPTLRAEDAADLLESARTRVFEDLEAGDSPQPAAPVAPAQTSTGASSPGPTRTPVAGKASVGADFEAVLAAELSDDLTLDETGDAFLTDPYYEHQLDPDEAELIEAPEVKPESQSSRDSLEEEMERLLGDLSRKP